MAALTIKFNYVQDYAVLYREDFIKYVGTILPKTIKRDHVNDVIVRCKRTDSDPSKQTDIRPLLFDLLDNIATTKLPKGKCEFFDSGCGLYIVSKNELSMQRSYHAQYTAITRARKYVKIVYVD